jgi:hypothetical protein
MDQKMQAALMKDFSAEQIGHKPATWCRRCSDVVRSRQGKSCAEHKVAWCKDCKTTITEAHVCLDFVGHADVRARLCETDPEWTWAPYEFPGTGSLVLNDGQPVGLWIQLTIGGVSKPGYGSVEKGKTDAMKELIGDAIRNAGLSFGIAWKLWAKGERTGNAGEEDSREPSQNGRPSAAQRGNDAPGGHSVRPAQDSKPAPASNDQPDPDAQAFADEASMALTTSALREIQARAREAHKLAALIRSPETGGTGGLGQYMNWRRQQLERAEKALTALREAGKTAGITEDELDEQVRAVTGSGIEDASAAQIEEATASLRQATASAS